MGDSIVGEVRDQLRDALAELRAHGWAGDLDLIDDLQEMTDHDLVVRVLAEILFHRLGDAARVAGSAVDPSPGERGLGEPQPELRATGAGLTIAVDRPIAFRI